MTHNIVAEFSCSIWKRNEEPRATSLGFSVGDFKQYPVVSGSVFNEEYNETLDSATILLSQVQKDDRLSYIKPYDFVRVYDKSTWDETTQTYGFDKTYLVDNFTEKENNIEEHIFGYTINLMSETKLLEKIQCPNLTITHDVNEDGTTTKKTIYQYIKQYMELFVPKIKYSNGGNWEYKPLIELSGNYLNDSESIQFVGSNFNERSINLTSDTINSNIDANLVEIIDYSIVTTPTLNWMPSSIFVFFDKENRVFKFQGSVSNFVMYEYTTPRTRFYENDFTFYSEIPGMGNEYEITVVVDTLEDDVIVTGDSSVQITNISVDAPLFWSTKEATFNSSTRQIIFHGICLGKADGEVSVDYECVKINGTVNINYRYLDKENDEMYKRFDVPCADLAFSTPTFRQLLTMLMQQVGCIPTVKNRQLSYLDFQKNLVQFGNGDYTVNHTVNRITRGLSSDSFANTLVNVSNQVLDSGNEVICETLGFRDRNNFLLKQKSNLYLETNFPIYKVNECILHAPGKYGGYISANYGCSAAGWINKIPGEDNGVRFFPFFIYCQNTISSNIAAISPSCIFYEQNMGNDPGYPTYHNIYIKNKTIYFLARHNDGSYYVIEEEPMDNIYLDRNNTIRAEWQNSYTFAYYTKTINISFTSSNVVGFFFSGYFLNSKGQRRDFSFIKFDDDNDQIQYFAANGGSNDNMPISEAVSAGLKLRLAGTRSWDISKLVVENSIRNCLETNFETMTTEINDIDKANTDNLSKYIYGTVGYSIGSSRIEGFSTEFVEGEDTELGWITKGYTYIENIVKALSNNFDYTDDLLPKYYGFLNYLNITVSPTIGSNAGNIVLAQYLLLGVLSAYQFKYYSPLSNSFSGDPFFTSMFVDLYYQPLNSFNLAYTKSIEEVDYPLQQYDSNASGLTDFDRLSLNEQEQVDRIGNETLSISQRTTEFNQIQSFNEGPLYFMDDTNRSGLIDGNDNGVKYTIFKYSYAINNNCFNASYTGSKDAILKDYFTSIRTKYRAYQYVDYNSSVLRKERDTFFVRIASNYFDGDDKVWWGTYTTKKSSNLVNLIYDVYNQSSLPIAYECEDDMCLFNSKINGKTVKESAEFPTKNSVSLITTQNMLGIIYECADNVGEGPYLTNYNENLGGVPQAWQLWDKEYSEKHTVTYVNYIDFQSYSISPEGVTGTISLYVAIIGLTPVVYPYFLDIYNSDNVIFSIVDNNKINATSFRDCRRTFYKDNAERINHTVQFIYYSPNNDVLFSEDFISGTPMVGRFDNVFDSIYQTNNFEINGNEHTTTETEIIDGITGTISLGYPEEISVKEVGMSSTTIPYTIYEHVFELDYSGLDDYTKILFNLAGRMIATGVSYISSTAEVIKSKHKIRCKIRSGYLDKGLFIITIPYHYNNIIENTVDSHSIPVLRIYWGENDMIKMCSKKDNGKVIDIAVFKRTEANTKYMSQNATTVINNPISSVPAVAIQPPMQRVHAGHHLIHLDDTNEDVPSNVEVDVIPYTDFYFTINDTKTDYVLSEKNGILYRRYKVATDTMDRTVEPIYEED